MANPISRFFARHWQQERSGYAPKTAIGALMFIGLIFAIYIGLAIALITTELRKKEAREAADAAVEDTVSQAESPEPLPMPARGGR